MKGPGHTVPAPVSFRTSISCRCSPRCQETTCYHASPRPGSVCPCPRSNVCRTYASIQSLTLMLSDASILCPSSRELVIHLRVLDAVRNVLAHPAKLLFAGLTFLNAVIIRPFLLFQITRSGKLVVVAPCFILFPELFQISLGSVPWSCVNHGSRSL